MKMPKDEKQLDGRQRAGLGRGSRFWMWMGVLPGLLALPAFYGVSRFGYDAWEKTLPALQLLVPLWLAFCSFKLMKSRDGMCAEGRFIDGVVWFFALAVLNFTLGIALLFGCCALEYRLGH